MERLPWFQCQNRLLPSITLSSLARLGILILRRGRMAVADLDAHVLPLSKIYLAIMQGLIKYSRMTQELVPNTGMELEVSATTPLEMSQAQDNLIAWCGRKIEAMKHEAAELAENLAIAIKNKWKTDTLRRHSALAEKRVTFYEKIKAALEAGYCIVPNFPITLFAIRTDREKPLKKVYVGTYEHSGDFTQEPKMLPVGEGDYKDPNPFVSKDAKKITDGSGKETTRYMKWATKFDDEITFPIQMAKPAIMEATSRAMALKVFDQLGILLPQAAKADPLIVGEILDPRSPGWGTRKRICFIIAWHLNVRDL